MVNQGYHRIVVDHCMYFKKFSSDSFIILLLYIDDMLLVEKNIQLIAKLKKESFQSFNMKDLGLACQILGMDITYDRKAKRLWLS